MVEASAAVPKATPGVEPRGWTAGLSSAFRNHTGTGTEPHWQPPAVREERTAQSSPNKLAARITALSQPSDEVIGSDVIAGRNVRASQLEPRGSGVIKAQDLIIRPKSEEFKPKVMADIVATTQGLRIKGTENLSTPPTTEAAGEAPEIIEPAEQVIVESADKPETSAPAVPDTEPETTPRKPVFSDELMKTMVPRSPISGKTYAEIEQERAKTNATATIKRAGSSKVDEVADSGAIKQEGPGVIERVSARASTLRGGIGKKTARVQEAIATAREDRAGEAAIQATLKKVATGTGETLPTATDTAGMTAEQRKQRFVETIQASYDRKGVTVPSAVTTPIEVAPDAAKPTDQPSPLK